MVLNGKTTSTVILYKKLIGSQLERTNKDGGKNGF